MYSKLINLVKSWKKDDQYYLYEPYQQKCLQQSLWGDMILQCLDRNHPRNDFNREQSLSMLILEVLYLCLHRTGINHRNLHQMLSIQMLYLLHLFCIACWYHYKSFHEKNKKKTSGQGNVVSHFLLLISCFANLLPTWGQHQKNILSLVDFILMKITILGMFLMLLQLGHNKIVLLIFTNVYSVSIQKIFCFLLNVFWWKSESYVCFDCCS